MKIKKYPNSASSSANSRQDGHRKQKGQLLLSLSSLLLLPVFLLVILNYGVYLKKTEYTSYIKETMLKVAKLDFAFVQNFASGQFTELEEMKVDIKFKHLQRLEYLREQSLQNKYILPSYKEESFPAEITYKEKVYPVKIGMTGKVAIGHLLDPAKWSFQVKVKGDQTINGMKRFGLLIPESRGFLTDWIALRLLKKRGLIQLRSDFVEVAINGKRRGTFYLEERFDKHLVENNRLREGIIFKIEEDLHPYKESKLLLSPETRPQLLRLRQLWQDVMAGHLPPQQFFDLKKMAKLFVIIDLMNEKHPLVRENLRFYFNPVTGLAEPIAREFKNLDNSRPPPLALFLEEPTGDSRHFRLTRDKVNRLIYDNDDFKRYYLQEAKVVCQKQFLDSFLEEYEDQLNLLLGQLYRTWPFYDLPTAKLYQYQDYMRSVLFPEKDQLIARFFQKKEDQINIHLQNQQFLPLEVSHLSWRDSIIFYPTHPIVLDSKANGPDSLGGYYSFNIPATLQLKRNFLLNLKVHYHLLGLEENTRSATVGADESLFWQDAVPSLDEKRKGAQLLSFMEERGNTWIIPPGKWVISKDLFIPKNKDLLIAPGSEIDLVNQARIISYSPVFCQGLAEAPIIVKSSDATGKGLLVLQADRRSVFSHTYFKQITDRKQTAYTSGGFLTFYESPVTIFACHFSDARVNGDLLQVIRSDFSIDKTQFANLQATAVRCTDCQGEIINSGFEKIAGHGIKVSGAKSDIKLRRIAMDHIDGEAISIEKNGQLEARWVTIRGAEVGILSQDRSIGLLSDVILQNTRNGLVLFQQNPQYGPAKITATRTIIEQVLQPYLVEQGSVLVLDKRRIPANKESVPELIYTSHPGSLSHQ